MISKHKKYFELLEISPNATLTEVKKAYRELSQIWHPDRFAHSKKLEKRALEHTKRLNEAFQQLESNWDEISKTQNTEFTEIKTFHQKSAVEINHWSAFAAIVCCLLLLCALAIPRKGGDQMRVISPSVASAHSTVYTNDLRFPLDSDAATGIFAAARECNLSSLQNLVEQGVEVNKKDGAGQSALVWAVRSHCVAGVKYLLEQGADRYSRSANGLDANGWARKYDNPQILELLGAT